MDVGDIDGARPHPHPLAMPYQQAPGIQNNRDRDSFSMAGGDSSPFGLSTPSTSRRNGSSSINKNECVTQIEPIVLSQRWTVSNFHTLIKLAQPGQCLRSNVFRDAGQPDACWQLCLYPGGKREENMDHVSLFLKMSATSPMKEVMIKAEYKFFFLDENDQPRFSNVNIGDFHAKPPKGGHSWGLRNIPKQKVLNCIRTDNSLVISCVIELIPDPSRVPCKKMSGPAGQSTEMVTISKIHADRELEMLRSSVLSDMVIEVRCAATMDSFENSGEEVRQRLPCHRFKLVSQSEVFRAMLTHESMEESKSGVIVIRDFSEAAVSAMLEFLYTGIIFSDISIVEYTEVMELAEKYDLRALKSICEDQLVTKVSLATVVECLSLAERFHAAQLQDFCVEMIVTNKGKVMDSEQWSDLKEHNPRLSSMVLEKMVVYNEQSPPVKKSRV